MARKKRKKSTRGTTSPLEFFGVELPPEPEETPQEPQEQDPGDSVAAMIERANRLNIVAATKEAGVHPDRRGTVIELLGKREIPRDDLGSYDDEALTGAVGEILEDMPFLTSPVSVTPLRFAGEPPGKAPA